MSLVSILGQDPTNHQTHLCIFNIYIAELLLVLLLVDNVVPTRDPRVYNTSFKTRGTAGTGGARRDMIGSKDHKWHGTLHDQFGVKFD